MERPTFSLPLRGLNAVEAFVLAVIKPIYMHQLDTTGLLEVDNCMEQVAVTT